MPETIRSKPPRRRGVAPVVCWAKDCYEPSFALGLCVAHHRRSLKHGDILVALPVIGREARQARAVREDGGDAA